LIILYTLMIFSDFIAPYEHNRIDSNYAWAPPSQIGFADGKIVTYALKQTLDEVRFEWIYAPDLENPIPVEFFCARV